MDIASITNHDDEDDHGRNIYVTDKVAFEQNGSEKVESVYTLKRTFDEAENSNLNKAPEKKTTSSNNVGTRSDTVSSFQRGRAQAAIVSSSRYHPGDHPFNRHGYKYVACVLDPCLQHNQFRMMDTPPFGARISWSDLSKFCQAELDGYTVSNAKGYRMARANCPIKEGRWFFEVDIINAAGRTADKGKCNPHVRIGIARREASVNAPVGFDGYSYCYRSLTGEKVTLSRPERYGESFQTGDVIGIYVSLPKRKRRPHGSSEVPFLDKRERIPIKYKDHLYFESHDYLPQKEYEYLMDQSNKPANARLQAELLSQDTLHHSQDGVDGNKTVGQTTQPSIPRLKGSCIVFYKNGICQGVAFEDIFDFLPLPELKSNKKGKSKVPTVRHDDNSLGYYPAVSMYGQGAVKLNVGPYFKYPPSADIEAEITKAENSMAADSTDSPATNESNRPSKRWRPYCEHWNEYMVEEAAQDLLDEVEADLLAKLDVGSGSGLNCKNLTEENSIKTLENEDDDISTSVSTKIPKESGKPVEQLTTLDSLL